MKYLPALSVLLLLWGCKPSPYPAHPDYAVKKPQVRYAPDKKNLAKMVKQLQGSPYVWAEEGPNYFDCSGFTYYLYGSMGIEIPRTAREQAKTGKRISPKELQYGDLIFFATDRHHPRKITHVGMYLGDGWFTHASTVKNEVVYSNLFTSPYYKKRLKVCRRYLPESRVSLASTNEPAWRTNGKHTKEQATQAASAKQGKAILIKAPMQQIEQPHKQTGNYYVQVGSFVGRPKSSLIYLIEKHGFPHKSITFSQNGKRISKLLIGPYPSREAALAIRTKVRKQIQKDAFIAEIR